MNQADRLNQTVLAEKSQERRKRNRIKARRNPISQITPSLHPHSPERASQVCFSCCCPREVRWAESALKGSLLHRRLKQVSLHPHLWIQAFSPSSIAFSCFPRTSIPREVQRQSVTMLIRNPRSLLKPHFSHSQAHSFRCQSLQVTGSHEDSPGFSQCNFIFSISLSVQYGWF